MWGRKKKGKAAAAAAAGDASPAPAGDGHYIHVATHALVVVYTDKPSWCDFCGDFIWETEQLARECQSCGAFVHDTCGSEANKQAQSTFPCSKTSKTHFQKHPGNSPVQGERPGSGKKGKFGFGTLRGNSGRGNKLPDSEAGCVKESAALARAGNLRRCTAMLQAAVSKFQENLQLRSRFCSILLDIRRNDDAQLQLSDLLFRGSHRAETHLLRAKLHRFSGEEQKALEMLALAANTEPENLIAKHLLSHTGSQTSSADVTPSSSVENHSGVSLPIASGAGSGVNTYSTVGGMTRAQLGPLIGDLRQLFSGPGPFVWGAVEQLLIARSLQSPASASVLFSLGTSGGVAGLSSDSPVAVECWQALEEWLSTMVDKDRVLSWMLAFARRPYFFGFMSADEAGQRLDGNGMGAYLIRASGSPGFLTISGLRGSNITHKRLQVSEDGAGGLVITVPDAPGEPSFSGSDPLSELMSYAATTSLFVEEFLLTNPVARVIVGNTLSATSTPTESLSTESSAGSIPSRVMSDSEQPRRVQSTNTEPVLPSGLPSSVPAGPPGMAHLHAGPPPGPTANTIAGTQANMYTHSPSPRTGGETVAAASGGEATYGKSPVRQAAAAAPPGPKPQLEGLYSYSPNNHAGGGPAPVVNATAPTGPPTAKPAIEGLYSYSPPVVNAAAPAGPPSAHPAIEGLYSFTPPDRAGTTLAQQPAAIPAEAGQTYGRVPTPVRPPEPGQTYGRVPTPQAPVPSSHYAAAAMPVNGGEATYGKPPIAPVPQDASVPSGPPGVPSGPPTVTGGTGGYGRSPIDAIHAATAAMQAAPPAVPSYAAPVVPSYAAPAAPDVGGEATYGKSPVREMAPPQLVVAQPPPQSGGEATYGKSPVREMALPPPVVAQPPPQGGGEATYGKSPVREPYPPTVQSNYASYPGQVPTGYAPGQPVGGAPLPPPPGAEIDPYVSAVAPQAHFAGTAATPGDVSPGDNVYGRVPMPVAQPPAGETYGRLAVPRS
jgi:Phorbol esters/diacylglycerol binding domain (C1 domain)/SH2 domain